MRRVFPLPLLTLVAALLLIAGCGSSSDLSRPETQKQFGVRMAKMNLWREAMFRFRRASEIDPSDAMAHNNLAVALEANGDFEGAAKEYREAMRLDRSNQYIQKNYSRLVEFTQRSLKREANPVTPPAATTAATPATPAATLPPAMTAPPASAPEPAGSAPAPPVTTSTTEPVAPPPPPTAEPPANPPAEPVPPPNPSRGGAA